MKKNPEESIDQQDDIAAVLTDLDEILSGLDESLIALPPTRPEPAPEDVAAPRAAASPAAPQAPPPPAAPPETMIELAPRAGTFPAKKKPAASKPGPARSLAFDSPPPIEPAPAEAPPAQAAPAGSDALDGRSDEIPETPPKDQVRLVAYVYTPSCASARASFAEYLTKAARTIPKKALYLREVMAVEVGSSSEPVAVFEKARASKAGSVLVVADDWPTAKIGALSDACLRGGLMFHAVSPADAQRKSAAVDVIADMMLLPGEA